MERNIEIRTPESIAFSYDLAGLGSRFLAVAVDTAVQILVIVGLFIGLLVAAPHIHASAPTNPKETHLAESLLLAAGVAFFFILFYGYFILFEAFWDGRTPGKKLLGIRVVRDGGYPVDFGSALVRNIVRIGEQILGLYLIAAISALISPENKRVGDFAAGTLVIRETQIQRPR